MKSTFALFFCIIFTMVACSPTSTNGKMTLKQCMELAGELNQTSSNLPIDDITILRNTFCTNSDGIEFIYNYYLTDDLDDVETSELADAIISEMKPNATQSWCTTPDLEPLIMAVDRVGLNYSKSNGTFITKYSISMDDCSN